MIPLIPEFDKREVQRCISSPLAMAEEIEAEKRTRLNLADILLGESFFVPFELIHEPTLRVKISRANTIPLGKRYRLIKHGPPAYAYEIACIAGPVREPENVGNADSEPEPEAADVSRETPQFVPPIEDEQ